VPPVVYDGRGGVELLAAADVAMHDGGVAQREGSLGGGLDGLENDQEHGRARGGREEDAAAAAKSTALHGGSSRRGPKMPQKNGRRSVIRVSPINDNKRAGVFVPILKRQDSIGKHRHERQTDIPSPFASDIVVFPPISSVRIFPPFSFRCFLSCRLCSRRCFPTTVTHRGAGFPLGDNYK
jgi:hypothetical protein